MKNKYSNILIVLCCFLCFSNLCISQKEGRNNYWLVSVSEGSNFTRFLQTDISTGYSLNLKSGKINFMGSYRLYGSLSDDTAYAYMQTNHLLGVTISYYLKEKRVAPVFGVQGLTEIATNYKDRYLKDSYFATTLPKFNDYIYSAQFYESTPFVLGIFIGVDVRIYKGLHILCFLENDFKWMKRKYLTWEKADLEHTSLNQLLKNQPINKVTQDVLTLNLGLSYYIPMHRKKKN